MSRMPLFVIPVGILIVTACRNPFLPPDGVPVVIEKPRSTPQGVIKQLIDAYENRQIDLYKDLFPTDGSFRFYLAPSLQSDPEAKAQWVKEPRDTRLQEIGESGYYFYWTQELELESHTRLFSKASRIEFTQKPFLESVRKFTDNGDSAAELLLTGGFLEIEYYEDIYTIMLYRTELERQVFLLTKDEENLWVISKWYDFSINK